ncbi:MAG: 3-phosphoshikimate 1-carboxyvinyltransferase [Acutalibacteraceae bacterium]
MVVNINKSKAYGRVSAPPSKSMAHRYLICGALSPESEIKGVGFSEDIKATLSCLASLGANVEIKGDTVKIGGIDIDKGIKSDKLFCNESGSTLRFLIPLCLLFGKEITLSGSERLMQRSLSVYADICAAAGLEFKQNADSVTVMGRLKAGKYSVRGDVSSQFISGLMFALPLLPNDSIIDITGALESGSYLGMTVKALADFGVRISRTDEHTIYIKGNQTYKPRSLTVEGDYSNAAFFEALNAVGGNVAVSGLSKASCQGDAVYKKLLGKIVRGTPQIDISDCPDLGPVLMAAAAANNGAHFTGTRRLKIKESDRGAAMAEELLKFGCHTEINDNDITVHGCTLNTPELPLNGHNDHRIVMSLAVLCTITGGRIYGAEAVSKSFPDFFERFSSLGIDLEVED